MKPGELIVKRNRKKSRLPPSRARVQTGQTPAGDIADATAALDLRLARAFVGFLNGGGWREAFAWVPAELERLASLAGVDYTGVPFAGLDSRPEPHMPTREAALRGDAAMAVQFIDAAVTSQGLDSHEFRHVRDRLNEQLAAFQVINVWRLATDGELREASIPRLDSPERCAAYVLGLMLLDRHDLRRGIKPCKKTDVQILGRGPGARHFTHFFLDLPNSKRLYCSPQHSAVDRKRRERSRPLKARRHK